MSTALSNHVLVDTRYSGNHGIARHSREIIPRLSIEWQPFQRGARPATAVDVLNPYRLRLRPSATLYSPGFSTGFARCKQLLTIHDLIHISDENSHSEVRVKYYEHFVKPAIKRAGHVLTVSNTSAKAIRNWVGDDSVQIHVTGIGCSDIFEKDGLVQTYDRPFFLFVGNFKAHKNARLLFEAMAYCRDYVLVVVAPPANSHFAWDLADRFGFSDRLLVRSDVSDAELASLYRGSEALVFPSRWEGFGLPVLEALKTGTNVVYCSEAESVAEICDSGQFAVRDSNDPKELSQQMKLAARSPFLCSADLSQYDWGKAAGVVTSAISAVVSQTGHR